MVQSCVEGPQGLTPKDFTTVWKAGLAFSASIALRKASRSAETAPDLVMMYQPMSPTL
jgi:hypothetical protein